MAYEGQRGTIGIEAPQLKSVERILSQINDLHAGIGSLEEITDHLAGDRKEHASNGPAAVPNGAIEQIEEGLRGLQIRLDLALTRLRPIA
jgi:hypothetical protein